MTQYTSQGSGPGVAGALPPPPSPPHRQTLWDFLGCGGCFQPHHGRVEPTVVQAAPPIVNINVTELRRPETSDKGVQCASTQPSRIDAPSVGGHGHGHGHGGAPTARSATHVAATPGANDANQAKLKDCTITFLLGGPGSGKGTQAALLVEEFGLVHLSVGDLLRDAVARQTEHGVMIDQMMKEGKIVPTEISLDLLQEAMVQRADAAARAKQSPPSFLVDGFPRVLHQATAFEAAIRPCDQVLYLSATMETLEKRLLKRGETSGRADDNLATIKKRFDTFQNQSMAVIDHYKRLGKCHEVSSEGSLQAVYAQCRQVFAGPTPPIFCLLGAPGVGKGVQAERLVKHFDYIHISSGDLLRAEVQSGSALGRQLDEQMREGRMIDDDVTIGLIQKAIRSHRRARGFLLDGFPRTAAQAARLDVEIGQCKRVLVFDVPDDIIVQRLLKRGETSGRADDNLESIKKRLVTFREVSLPVIQHYQQQGRVEVINADQDIQTVFYWAVVAINTAP